MENDRDMRWREFSESWAGFFWGRLLDGGVQSGSKGVSCLDPCFVQFVRNSPEVLMGPELGLSPCQLAALLIHAFNPWRHTEVKPRCVHCQFIHGNDLDKQKFYVFAKLWEQRCCLVGHEGHSIPVPCLNSRNRRRSLCPEMFQMSTVPAWLPFCLFCIFWVVSFLPSVPVARQHKEWYIRRDLVC